MVASVTVSEMLCAVLDVDPDARVHSLGDPELVKLRHYFDHPLFVEMFAEGIRTAAATLPAELRGEAKLVFTAHSVPVAADERQGPRLYSRQVAYATRLVAASR